MTLKEGGLRGSLRNVGMGVSAIPDSGLLHNYDAQSLSGFSDGDTVSTFTDQEGTNDASANGAPEYQSSGINSNPSVLVDGTDDEFVSSAHSVGSNDEYTFAMVVLPVSWDDFDRLIRVGDSDGYLVQHRQSDQWAWRHIGVGNDSGNGTVSSDPHILLGAYDGSNKVFKEDGTEIYNQSAGYTHDTGSQYFGSAGGSAFFNVHLGQILFYNEFKTSSERQDIESYLADRWGITL